tara:strand:+ start:74 stop:478 length:405 start_codon:yes stop_codon:yes gene_type:complete
MLEFFGSVALAEHMNNKNKKKEEFNNEDPMVYFNVNDKGFVAGMIVSLIISIITAVIAFQCNKNAKPGVKFIITLFAFFFSGFYLVYYFIVYVIFDSQCNGNNNFLKAFAYTSKRSKKKQRTSTKKPRPKSTKR